MRLYKTAHLLEKLNPAIWVKLGIWPNWVSSGVATEDAIVCGTARNHYAA